jgi:hypothetical protein
LPEDVFLLHRIRVPEDQPDADVMHS